MKRFLVLTSVLALALILFTGCANTNNPMEISDSYSGSEQLSTNSIQSTPTLTVNFVNTPNPGKLVISFHHGDIFFQFNSLTINGTETIVTKQIINDKFGTTLLILDPNGAVIYGNDQDMYILDIVFGDGSFDFMIEIEGITSGHFGGIDIEPNI